MSLQRGDHLVSSRLGYSHHGLYVGNNQVIHYQGPFSGMNPVRWYAPHWSTSRKGRIFGSGIIISSVSVGMPVLIGLIAVWGRVVTACYLITASTSLCGVLTMSTPPHKLTERSQP